MEKIMINKKNVFALLIATFLISCSGTKEETSLSDSAMNTGYVEYLFCDFGPEMSEETFSQMLIEWNEILDGLEVAVPMSVGLVPRTETDLYDGMWTLVWESEEQAKIGWEEWVAGPAESWTEETSEIISCGASDNGEEANYAFDVNVFRSASAADSEPGGVVGFMFCSYSEEFGEAELTTGLETFNGWLNAGEEASGSTTPYFYTIHVPTFETPIPGSSTGSYDYAFHQFWDSEESREEGARLFAETAPAVDGPQPDCSQEILFDSIPFRTPQI
jgi:hypothetical protein